MSLDHIKKVLDFGLIEYSSLHVKVHHLVALAIVFIVTKFLLFVVNRFIHRQLSNEDIDKGRARAVFQLAQYVIVVMAIIIGLEILGIKLTIVLAGSAALLVGLGLGIQSLFNDMVSGVVLLFEGTVSVGDIVEVDGIVGEVKHIDLRTSKIESRDRIVIVVPNSKLVGEKVINWSHNRLETRFKITVGVAYGSDVRLAQRLLEEAASEHEMIVSSPAPQARFVDFGSSSLDFDLLFHSKEMFRIEFVKSDLRFSIDEKFRKNNITIPFPQRDVHMIPSS